MEQLDRITSPDYTDGLNDKNLEQLRGMRTESDQLENALSYVRRILQGRLDIVGGELTRRRDGADPAAIDDIIERIPETLAEHSRGTGLPRPPQDMAPSELCDAILDELSADHALGPIPPLPDMSDDDLSAAVGGLTAAEEQVSGSRRQLHGVIDSLQDEIIRRYKTGEASVESLLT